MAAEDRNGEVSTQGECTGCSARESSFDELAKGLASGTISRRGVLRLMGSAIVGTVLASVSGVAWAAPPEGRGRPCVLAQRARKSAGTAAVLRRKTSAAAVYAQTLSSTGLIAVAVATNVRREKTAAVKDVSP